MLPHPQIVAALALLGVGGYLGVHNLAIGYGRQGSTGSRWIGLWSVLSSAFLLASLEHWVATEIVDAAFWLRVQAALVGLFPPVLVGMVAALTGASQRRVVLGLAALGGVFAALALSGEAVVRSEGSFFVNALGLRYAWVTVTPVFGLPALLGVAGFVSVWRSLGVTRALPGAQARALRGALSLYLAMGLWDGVLAALDLRTMPLFPFAMVLLGAAFERFSVLRIREARHALELGVAHRTAELADANAQLAAAVEASRRAGEARQLFLARMSHELRTPLNAIAGSAELLQRTSLAPPQANHVGAIQAASESLLTQVTSVLEYVRVESSSALPVTREVIAVRPSLRALLQEHEGAAADAGLSLELGFAADLPDEVEVDPYRLRQILGLLLDHALASTQRGGVRVRVGVSASALVVSVSDTGPGLSPAGLAGLFEPFSAAVGGFGLSLSLCRVVLDRLGGSIRAESRVGEGTTLAFELPAQLRPSGRVRRDSSEKGVVDASRTRLRRGTFTGGTRVLVAEDVLVNQVVISTMLRELGVDSVLVDDGAAAVATYAEDERFDAILMDCQMPVLDGYEATRQIRAREAGRGAARVPIVAVTAHALPEEHARALDAGMDFVVTKPVSIASLQHALARTLPSRFDGGPQVQSTGEVKAAAPDTGVEGPAAPSFDPRRLDELDSTGTVDPAFFADLIDSFERTSAKYVRALEAALTGTDTQAVARAAHSIKGASASFGARRLAALATEVVEAARRGEAPGAEVVARLEAEVASAVEAARGWHRARSSA